MRLFARFCGLVSLCYSLAAQQTTLSGPLEGFAFDAPTHSLRAVIGAVGSASLGPILLPQVDYASIAPHKDYGIVAWGRQYRFVSGLASGQPSWQALGLELAAADGIAWSGDGSTAILYSRTGNWMRLLTGLPNSPDLGSVVDLSALGGSLNSVAADTQGNQVAIAISGNAAGVYGMKNSSGFVPLLYLANPIALAFSDDGATLYALDQAANAISALSMSNSASVSWTLDGLQDPFAIAAGTNSSSRPALYVASRNDCILRVYDPSTGQSTASLPLPFEPTGIEALGRASFLLASRLNDGDPLWSLSTVSDPAILFIPATPLPQGKTPVEPHPLHPASGIQ